MNLSSVIGAAAYKRLAAVDLPGGTSNQHELNGVQSLCEFFGTSTKISGQIKWLYFADDNDPVTELSDFTFYDSRENHPSRSEWRLYYAGDFLKIARPDDILILVRLRQAEAPLMGLVVQRQSSWQRAAEVLFRVTSLDPVNFELSPADAYQDEIDLLGTRILEEMGLADHLSPSETDQELVLRLFRNLVFPSTVQMSQLARDQAATDEADPDSLLLRWLQREEQLFRALERLQVEARLKDGFSGVDEFIKFSLSVHNRRKSRMGYSLQHQLASVFDKFSVRYTAQARINEGSPPDFIFPGQDEYNQQDFPADRLVMLGAKSTLKDRWRQVLVEAKRIPAKHLCTLEPGISTTQTADMLAHSIRLVIPKQFHETFTTQQRQGILTLSQFIEQVRSLQ